MQDSGHCSQLGFRIGTILAIFDQQVIFDLPSFESIGLPRITIHKVVLILPTKLRIDWISVQEKNRRIDFQNGGHLGCRIETILAIFDLQVAPILPTKFRVNKPFSLGAEALDRLSR